MNAVEIFPGLWLGDKHIIENINFFKEKDITCIINCEDDKKLDNIYESEWIRISFNQDIYGQILHIITYIHKLLNKNKSIIIYCQTGRQKSATIIAAYIIYYGKVSAKQAVEYIRSKKEDCFLPKVNYYLILQKIENKSMI